MAGRLVDRFSGRHAGRAADPEIGGGAGGEILIASAPAASGFPNALRRRCPEIRRPLPR